MHCKTTISRAVAFLLAAVSVMSLAGCEKKTEARIIKAVETSGEVSYTRNSEVNDVYVNMNFEPKDYVYTSSDSTLDMQLDADKFVHVFENTELNMEYSGNETDGMTSINLVSGEIYNNITVKLSDNSSYEVRTSNATIGVRGTTFYVKAEPDRTVVACESGTVNIKSAVDEIDITSNEIALIENDTIKEVPYNTISDELSLINNPELPITETEPSRDDFITKWENPIIENAVREYLGKPSGDIMASELDDVTALYIIGNEECCINKPWNEFGINGISWTPSEQDTFTINYSSGEEKKCNPGTISSLGDVLNFRNLINLSIVWNNISDISCLSQAEQLLSLDLCHNRINDISVLSNLVNLDGLYLDSNDITYISSISKLTHLTRLNLSRNRISDISSLSDLSELEYLYIDNNSFSNISSLSNKNKIKELHLDYNSVNDISPLLEMSSLEDLYISETDLSEAQINELKTKHPNCNIIY